MSESELPLTSASWSKRFIAYLIDFVVVLLVLPVITMFTTFPAISSFSQDMEIGYFEPTSFLIISLTFFMYWTILEFTARKTVGKKLLGLEVTTIYGTRPKLQDIAISSFGKAFVLPFDVILGWLFTNSSRQRLFSKFGKIIVIETKDHDLVG